MRYLIDWKTEIMLAIALFVSTAGIRGILAQEQKVSEMRRCYSMDKDPCLKAIRDNNNITDIESKCNVTSDVNTVPCSNTDKYCIMMYGVEYGPEEEILLANYSMKPWMRGGHCWGRSNPCRARRGFVHQCCDPGNGTCLPHFDINDLRSSLRTSTPTTQQSTTATVFIVDHTAEAIIDDGTPENGTLIAICVSVVFVIALVIIMIVLCLSRQCKAYTDSEAAINSCSSDETINKDSGNNSDTESDLTDVPDIEYATLPLIGKGRYSQLLKLGQYKGHDCVLKMTDKSECDLWMREKMMFNTPGFEHENIVKCYGSFVAPLHHREMCVLILEYHKRGSLCNYLNNHSLTWNEVIHICHTMAAGISHLHEVTTINNNIKYPIAHRDLKSDNILLTSDLSAVITDFNLAYSLEEQDLKQDTSAALNMAGTWRYLAPEMLDTAITQDSLSCSLLAADIYSSALIMWEVLSMWQNSQEKPIYMLPYADHFKYPTREQLRILVFDQKMRPDFPARIIKQQNKSPDLSELISTIQASWDNDPESRLTASCIKHRLEELEYPPTTFSRVGSFFHRLSLRSVQSAITRKSIRRKKNNDLSVDIIACI